MLSEPWYFHLKGYFFDVITRSPFLAKVGKCLKVLVQFESAHLHKFLLEIFCCRGACSWKYIKFNFWFEIWLLMITPGACQQWEHDSKFLVFLCADSSLIWLAILTGVALLVALDLNLTNLFNPWLQFSAIVLHQFIWFKHSSHSFHWSWWFLQSK